MIGRFRTAVALAAAALALAPAGCGGDSKVVVISTPDTFDAVLRQALVENGVVELRRPPPESTAVVELGEMLFHDPILSGARDIACAGCHQAQAGLGDGVPLSIGTGARGRAPSREKGTGVLIPRNAPHLFNVGLPAQTVAFHDGRVARDPATGIIRSPVAALNVPVPFPPSTEAEAIAAQLTSAAAVQATLPVLSREEMRGLAVDPADDNELADVPDDQPFEVWRRIMKRLIGDPGAGPANPTHTAYRALFQAAYPGTPLTELNYGHAARAIAAYEREDFSSLDSPFDRYVRGDSSALSVAQKRGALTFFGKTKKGKCANCHSGPLLTDFGFHALAIPQIGPGRGEPGKDPLEDSGRAAVTGDPADLYKFKTPSLRNIERAGPFFHDGAYPTLRDVVVHYDDIEAGLMTYEARFVPLLDPALGIDFDGDPARVQARLQASRNDGLLPQRLGLTAQEIDDLVEFMRALTDDTFADPPPASVPSGLPVGGG